jgi:hypothetical protein
MLLLSQKTRWLEIVESSGESVGGRAARRF